MSQPNVAQNVPSAIFLAPIINLKNGHQQQSVDLQRRREVVNEVLTRARGMHDALPSTARTRFLFEMEEQFEEIVTQFRTTGEIIDAAIENLHQIAMDAMTKVDPKYREEALRLVHEAEQAALTSRRTVNVILEEIDFANGQLLVVH